MNKRKINPVLKTDNSFQLDDDQYEPFVNIEYIQNYLGVPRKTIYKWSYEFVTSGFPSYKIGRHLKFRLSEIEKWLQKYSHS
jgi:excisionase family DNA binding protein